jgi:ZIP family zinc transporter
MSLSTETYAAVILLSLLSCVTTCIGVALAIRIRESPNGIALGIGFSAGIMMVISIVELLPEAIETAGAMATAAVAACGVGIVWALHFIIPHTHLVKEAGKFNASALRSAYLIVFGLILHDVPEGFAMANSYVASPGLGVLVAIAIALHNIPEEFAMATPVVTLRKRRFLYGAAIASALAEPVGAIIGLVAVDAAPALNPLLMAFAAGAMIFVSVHELLPMARRYRRPMHFMCGAAASIVVYAILNTLIPN